MSTVPDNIGFGRSEVQHTVLASGGTTFNAVDLGRPYAFIVIRCNNCQYIQAATTMSAKVGDEADDTLVSVRTENDQNGAWVSSTLPTSNGFRMILSCAGFARRIQLVLSQATSGGATTFDVYGYDSGIN